MANRNILMTVRSMKFLNIAPDGNNIDEIFQANFNSYIFNYQGDIKPTELDFVRWELDLMSIFEYGNKPSDSNAKHKMYVEYLKGKLKQPQKPQQPKLRHLKDLFESEQLFHATIDKLVENGIIESSNDRYKIVKGTGTENIMAICIMTVLQSKNYFKKTTNKEMTEIIKSFFDVEVTEQQFGKYKNEMNDSIHEHYTSQLYFITKL
jgi:hypothetical protein